MNSFSSCRYLLANVKNNGVGHPLPKVHHKYTMQRPICQSCHQRPCAVNYHKQDVTHYRSRCENCTRKKRGLRPRDPRWKSAGYKKKPTCDLCGFRSIFSMQTTVFHIDGKLENTELTNLRTICLNCVEVVKRKEVTWKRGDLEVD